MVQSHFATLNTLFLRFFVYILLSVMCFLDCEKRIEVVSFFSFSSSCSFSTVATSSYLPPSSSLLFFFFFNALTKGFPIFLPNLISSMQSLSGSTSGAILWHSTKQDASACVQAVSLTFFLQNIL